MGFWSFVCFFLCLFPLCVFYVYYVCVVAIVVCCDGLAIFLLLWDCISCCSFSFVTLIWKLSCNSEGSGELVKTFLWIGIDSPPNDCLADDLQHFGAPPMSPDHPSNRESVRSTVHRVLLRHETNIVLTATTSTLFRATTRVAAFGRYHNRTPPLLFPLSLLWIEWMS